MCCPIQGLISGRGRRMFSFPKHADRLWCSPSLIFKECQMILSREVKWLEHEVGYWPSSSPKIRNDWNCTITTTTTTTTTCIYLQGMDMDAYNFSIVFFLIQLTEQRSWCSNILHKVPDLSPTESITFSVRHFCGLPQQLIHCCKGKGKAVPLQARRGPEGSRKLRFPDFVTTAQGHSVIGRILCLWKTHGHQRPSDL